MISSGIRVITAIATKPPISASEMRFGIFIVKRSFAAANAIATGNVIRMR